MSEDTHCNPESLPNLPPAMLAALDSYDPGRRRQALSDTVSLVNNGHITTRPAGSSISLHTPTFNSDGCCSPSRLVWEARRQGLAAIGSCDPDNLDALGELYAAGDVLSVRAAVCLKTRVLAMSHSDVEINVPGEPGLLDVMAVGVTRIPAETSQPGRRMIFLKEQARRRCKAMVSRMNAVLAPISVSFDRDVLPLTPYGNASESHVCAAFAAQARKVFPHEMELSDFWANVLNCRFAVANRLVAEGDALLDAIRGKFLAKGGSAYQAPTPTAFIHVNQFFQNVTSAGAVPCLCWRDGLSAGEQNPERLLDGASDWGALCVGVTFSASYMMRGQEVCDEYCGRLRALAKAARARALPILAGSDMLKDGSFGSWPEAPELDEFRDDFLAGGRWLYGHTLLNRHTNMGFVSDWSNNVFSGDRAAAVKFYTEAGELADPGPELESRVANIGQHMWPNEVLAALR